MNTWMQGQDVGVFYKRFLLFQEKSTSFLYCWPGSKSAKIDKLLCYRWDGYSLLENEHVWAGNQQNKSYLKVVGLSESAWVMFVNQMRLCLCCREVVRKLVREFEEVQKLEELHSVIHDSFYRYEPLGYLLLLETSLIVLNSLRIIVELKSDVMNMIHLTAFFNTVILWWKIRTFSTQHALIAYSYSKLNLELQNYDYFNYSNNIL